MGVTGSGRTGGRTTCRRQQHYAAKGCEGLACRYRCVNIKDKTGAGVLRFRLCLLLVLHFLCAYAACLVDRRCNGAAYQLYRVQGRTSVSGRAGAGRRWRLRRAHHERAATLSGEEENGRSACLLYALRICAPRNGHSPLPSLCLHCIAGPQLSLPLATLLNIFTVPASTSLAARPPSRVL